MAVRDICNAALRKVHYHEMLPVDYDPAAPVGKAQEVCALLADQSRRSALRMGAWTCIMAHRRLASDAWSALTAYSIGDLVVAGTNAYRCTAAGTSAGTAPTWPDAGTVADGTVTWTFDYATIEPYPESNYTGLAFCSPMPADYLMRHKVTDPSGNIIHFEMAAGVIYTDIANPVLVYVPDEDDDTKYDSLLREAVIIQLAFDIAGPLTSDAQNEARFQNELLAIADVAFSKTGKEARQGLPASEEWRPGLFTTRVS